MTRSTRIKVVCGEPSHSRGKVARVDEFYWSDWIEVWDREAPEHTSASDDRREVLHGDEVLRGDIPQGVPLRVRYRLVCPLCDLSLVVRHERLTPVLDKLAGSGVSVISLKDLATILS